MVLVLVMMVLLSFPYYPAEASTGMVSIRNVFESMGAQVEWIPEGQVIRIQRGKNQIQLAVGSRIAYKNGQKITMDQSVRLNGTTHVAEMSTRHVYELAKTDDLERHYRVQANDTLWRISTRYGVTIDQLMEWNGLMTPVIYPGQHLHISDPYYTVQQGDTLSKIASSNESTVVEIKRANGLAGDMLQPGQRLFIPPQASIKPPDLFKEGIFPLVDGTYQSYRNDYGDPRSFSTTGNTRSHEGVDIFAKQWIPIFAVDNGRVIRKGWNYYGGWRLTIESNNGIAFYYAHMTGYAEGTNIGTQIRKGQLIGFVGSTGYGEEGTRAKFEPHLHLGMYDTKSQPWKPMNPYWYLRWWEFQ
ncbi:LysM peptidoglycan-binding domain-containing protein [Ammoniphilus sp. YIM 78166]|uniref:LysM peptidoglycan-binding domain-containing protein n=1 Tax=Ammoniphilus sp. YIM 78166 TaxID=1644106 RepID=UPI0014316326|nr:LysM peptidoglycan-binding domain-containing protein [Ammoniphilus sp. YIM 78166]